MDAIVEQALLKWPNVPHCHGWLALDARGNWRMRNEHAQQHNLPGDRITQPALIGFIRRNYAQDEFGCWFFQNGPQRVYVDLEAAPYIARMTPSGFVLHTEEALHAIEAAWLTEEGRLFLQGGERIALLDDRDLAACLPLLQIDAAPIGDEQLTMWLEQGAMLQDSASTLVLRWEGSDVPVSFLQEAMIAERFRFVRQPRPAPDNPQHE